MADLEKTSWNLVNAELAIYRYPDVRQYRALSDTPVLMLHGPMTDHQTWNTLATFLWVNGFSELYAVDIEDIQNGSQIRSSTIDFFGQVVNWVLDNHGPQSQIILIGHSTGGVLGRRYILRAGEIAGRISYLFTLASPHHRTHFTHALYIPPEHENEHTSMSSSQLRVVTPYIPQDTVLVNFIGNKVGRNYDGTVRGVHLPEAANVVLPLEHKEFKTHPSVQYEILAFLKGERRQVQIHLEELLMRTVAEDGQVGSFCFEINGLRSPFDGAFQAEAEMQYTFDEQSTPLATLIFKPDYASVLVDVQLKDLSRQHHIKRRLFAKILVSLTDSATAVHAMQDNQASKITMRIQTRQVPKILENGQ